MTLFQNRVLSTIVLALIFGFLVYVIWTRNIDPGSWLMKKVERVLEVPPAEDQPIFSVTADLRLGPIDTSEHAGEEPKTWSKVRLSYRLSIRTETARWSRSSTVGVVYYSGDGLYDTESELPTWAADSLELGEKPPHHRLLHQSREPGQINSAQRTSIGWMEAHISVTHTPWIAAIYVLPEDKPPQWFQLTIERGVPNLEPGSDSGVQVRGYRLVPTTNPRVSAGYDELFK